MDSSILWSEQNYSMREIVESCSQSFPLICKTTTGYSGCDEDILQIGSGETFWVFEIHRQQRLVVKTTKSDCYLSIPIGYPIKAQMLHDGSNKVGDPVPIREIVHNLKKETSPVRFIFDKNCKVSFQIGADMGGSAKFDVLTAEQVYDEKYLLAHSICNMKLFSRPHAIPVYLPIEFSVAKGLVDREAETWLKWTSDIAQLPKQFKSSPIRTTEEIILFNERPSNGEYEYIKLSDFSKLKEKDKIFSSSIKKREKENAYESVPTTNRRGGLNEPNRNFSVPLPRVPPPPPHDQDGKTIKVPVATAIYHNKRTPPPIPAHSSTKKQPSSPETPSQNLYGDPKHGTEYGAPKYESLGVVDESSSFNIYASLAEVPVDIDFSKLSVEEVADCLKLLKMESHCDDFRKRHIDGEMAVCLNEKMLMEEFNFRSFDARQFLLFVKEKWRPKRTNSGD